MENKTENLLVPQDEVVDNSEETNSEDIWNIPALAVDRTEFIQKMHKLAKRHAINTKIIPQDKYHHLIEHVKQINKNGRKNSMDFRRNRKYALIVLPNGEERLFYKPALAKNQHLMMVTLEETFDIIHKCHMSQTNHGGRSRMMDLLKTKYYNITVESLMLYLSMCYNCKVNRAFAKKNKREEKVLKAVNEDSSNDAPSGDLPESSIAVEMVKDEVISESAQKYPELYLRGQVDLLCVTNEPTEEYKYLMVYRNYATKFVNLKAMTGISIDETTDALLEIFLVFGAPNVLQSKNGVAILKPICSRITSVYPDFKIVYSENIFPNSAFQGKTNEDILKKLNAWLVMSQNTKWQFGVKYIQHSLNTTFEETICRTPSQLVFGCNPSKGIGSFLNNTVNIFSESDLLTLLDSKNGDQDINVKNNLILTESLIIPGECIKLEVESLSDEENLVISSVAN